MTKSIYYPLNKAEACKILGFKETAKPTAEQIMSKYDKLYENNKPIHGGSIYLQAKIHHAKELLMKGHNSTLNKSVHDNE